MVKKLTLKDIAELSGVSLTTASMYINGKAEKYKLAKATCERIEQIIQKYNFQPNVHARAIAGKKTFLIGIIISGTLNRSFWIDILAGIEATVAAAGSHIILSVVHNCTSSDDMLATFKFMVGKGVDGIIFASLRSDKNVFAYLEELYRQKPLVSLTVPTAGIPSVYNDNATGGKHAAEYLYNAGHRSIAYIGIHEHPDRRNIAFLTI